jgi:hypothetical protein
VEFAYGLLTVGSLGRLFLLVEVCLGPGAVVLGLLARQSSVQLDVREESRQ